MRIRPNAIRFLMLAACAAALLAVPVLAASGAEATGRHLRKHLKHESLRLNPNLRLNNGPWVAGATRPVARPNWGGSVCPGNARSFDCAIWPPPIEDDPDRKASSSDGS